MDEQPWSMLSESPLAFVTRPTGQVVQKRLEEGSSRTVTLLKYIFPRVLTKQRLERMELIWHLGSNEPGDRLCMAKQGNTTMRSSYEGYSPMEGQGWRRQNDGTSLIVR